ncbi:hypothetical protein PORCRE_1179 [Porphyromonas crevioricanis JCM 15906]|uniref:Uncharacterized protein n=2 Tax=Porphyromonas crevioricanis TaxID=393921 RepID=A0A2X4PI62_9PORP|nr:hypothetical protein PORCRE_1179 [Porphyromonas crevioricanis JCM 15906]GAD07703.1 hypothetical protein PORCAN_1327 [Porphyromonas crevioricanis JCM 13913]SJZ94427.1 hypothetical protein SAMN02745203_01352 [Porphyromonas crevioricanis]SQH73616.1 Uncharacterised protein [Porphyromonas crevioricanis]
MKCSVLSRLFRSSLGCIPLFILKRSCFSEIEEGETKLLWFWRDEMRRIREVDSTQKECMIF